MDLYVLYQKGLEALRKGRIDEGIELLEQVVSSDLYNSEFRFDLGRAYFLDGDLRSAIEEWGESVRLDPKNKVVQFILDMAKEKLESEDEGIKPKLVRKVKEIMPWRILEDNILCAILCIALIIRLLYYFYVIPVNFNIDAYHHWQISYFSLTIGFPKYGFFYDPGAWMILWPPLPHIVQMIFLVFDRHIEFMTFFNIIIGTATIIPVYRISSMLRDRESGLTAATLYSVLPIIVATNVQALNEPLIIFLIAFAFQKIYENNDFHAGLLWGLASLCRQEIFSLFLVVFIVNYFFCYRNYRKIQDAVKGFTLIFLPYSLFYYFKGFDPLRSMRPYLMRMMLFPFKKIPFINNYPEIGLFITIALLSLTVIYLYRRKSVALDSIDSMLKRILGMEMMPLYAFLMIYIVGFLDMKIITSFWKAGISIFRYSSIPLSIIIIPISILISRLKNKRTRLIFQLALISSLMILNIPFAKYYTEFRTIPLSYVEPGKWIAENYHGGKIVVDNQFLIYQLTAVNGIQASKILGSYWAGNPEKMRENNATIIVFTDIGWDGSNTLFNKLNKENVILLYNEKVSSLVNFQEKVELYVYKIEW